MYQPLITFCPHPAIFTQVLRIFAKVSKSVTGRKLQHICGELCGVIGIEDLCKMLIMSKEP